MGRGEENLSRTACRTSGVFALFLARKGGAQRSGPALSAPSPSAICFARSKLSAASHCLRLRSRLRSWYGSSDILKRFPTVRPETLLLVLYYFSQMTPIEQTAFETGLAWSTVANLVNFLAKM